jgi:hypothetical protein
VGSVVTVAAAVLGVVTADDEDDASSSLPHDVATMRIATHAAARRAKGKERCVSRGVMTISIEW